jgi:hypothetical protein
MTLSTSLDTFNPSEKTLEDFSEEDYLELSADSGT